MDWTTGRSRFHHRQRREDFSSDLCVQTGSGAHPASCTMGTVSQFPGGKERSRRDAGHSPHLVPRSWMSRSYTFSPPCAFIGLLWDSFTFGSQNPCRNLKAIKLWLKFDVFRLRKRSKVRSAFVSASWFNFLLLSVLCRGQCYSPQWPIARVYLTAIP
jgi:hypothetical protein